MRGLERCRVPFPLVTPVQPFLSRPLHNPGGGTDRREGEGKRLGGRRREEPRFARRTHLVLLTSLSLPNARCSSSHADL